MTIWRRGRREGGEGRGEAEGESQRERMTNKWRKGVAQREKKDK